MNTQKPELCHVGKCTNLATNWIFPDSASPDAPPKREECTPMCKAHRDAHFFNIFGIIPHDPNAEGDGP